MAKGVIWTTRSEAERVVCPRCGAAQGVNCMGVRRRRESSHAERHGAAESPEGEI